MTEASLLADLRWDALAAFHNRADWYKVHDAVKKGRPDVTFTAAGFVSYVEAKYAPPGQTAEEKIREKKSKLQLATASRLWQLSGGRVFYAVWVRPENPLEPLRTEVWVPAREAGGLKLYRAAVREHFGAFENGLFTDRLKTIHSAEYRP